MRTFINIETTNETTTWEDHNYILFGLVNELIGLGAKDDLKLVTLQLWTTYLRRNEVAFFSKKEIKLPKLGASFNRKYVCLFCACIRLIISFYTYRDACIIYNLKSTKRSVKSAKSISVGTSKKRTEKKMKVLNTFV